MPRLPYESDRETLELLGRVDRDSSVPAYLQIENQIRFAIASGRLKPGGQLPSVRELTTVVGVNANTVSKAYRELVVMGLLHARRGVGVFIQEGAAGACRLEVRTNVVRRIHEALSEGKAAGFSKRALHDLVSAIIEGDGRPYGPIPAALLTEKKQSKPGRRTKKA